MKYFNQIKCITNEFFEGKLRKFSIENSEFEVFKISISYTDNYNYDFDYDFEINFHEKCKKFICHHILNSLYNVSLNRNVVFEDEIQNVLVNEQLM